MELTNVSATVAIQRMYLYALEYSMVERDNLAHTLLSGHSITYLAVANTGERLGSTTVIPEQTPVATVTEINS